MTQGLPRRLGKSVATLHYDLLIIRARIMNIRVIPAALVMQSVTELANIDDNEGDCHRLRGPCFYPVTPSRIGALPVNLTFADSSSTGRGLHVDYVIRSVEHFHQPIRVEMIDGVAGIA